MSLNYNILWVDDRKEDYQAIELDKDIENHVKDLFFEPHIYMYESVEEAEQEIHKCKFDVVFSDYNIGENKNGKDFITDIRKQNINSEILFYTAKKDSLMTEFDRISILRLKSDNSYDDLKRKMFSVIDLTVEKLSDLSNLRGLVMAEVSELDDIMQDILIKYYSYYIDKKNDLDEVISNQEETIKRLLENTENCNKQCTLKIKNKDKTVEEKVKKFDAAHKAMALNKIISIVSYIPRKKNFYEDYLEEIINNRNNLAHCKSVLLEGKEVLKTRQNDLIFDSDLIKDIRRNIKKYHDLFCNLQDKVVGI